MSILLTPSAKDIFVKEGSEPHVPAIHQLLLIKQKTLQQKQRGRHVVEVPPALHVGTNKQHLLPIINIGFA